MGSTSVLGVAIKSEGSTSPQPLHCEFGLQPPVPVPGRWEQPPECEGSGSVKDLYFWQGVPGHRTCQPNLTLPLLEHGQCVTRMGALCHTSGKRSAQMFGSTLHDSGPRPAMSQPCGPTQRHTPHSSRDGPEVTVTHQACLPLRAPTPPPCYDQPRP